MDKHGANRSLGTIWGKLMFLRAPTGFQLQTFGSDTMKILDGHLAPKLKLLRKGATKYLLQQCKVFGADELSVIANVGS